MTTKRLFLAFLMAAFAALNISTAPAQTYPTSNPTYIPTAILAPQTFTTTGNYTYAVSGIATVTMRVSGTCTGLVSTVQGSNDATNYTSMSITPVAGGANVSSVTGTGFWRINSAGLSRVRLNITALAASCTVAMAGTEGTGVPTAAAAVADLGALITNGAATAGTNNSATQSGIGIRNVTCLYNQATHANTPSTTITIQNRDSVSGNFYGVVTSSAVTTTDAVPQPIYAGEGIATTANVSAGVAVAPQWRVQQTIGGTTPVVSGTVSCFVK